MVPYNVSRYFTDTPIVRQLYFSAADPSHGDSGHGTGFARSFSPAIGRSRVYVVQNLTDVVTVADRTANALTLVLLLIATVTLLVSGIGIMNIMLATVTSRIREIGIRKAIGATNRRSVSNFCRRQF